MLAKPKVELAEYSKPLPYESYVVTGLGANANARK
jgi:hypothetical protein